MITNKGAARAILLAGAAELSEMEFDRMARFYASGEHDSTTLSAMALAHTWASISMGSSVPLGSINSEIERLTPGDAWDVLMRVRNDLERLDV